MDAIIQPLSTLHPLPSPHAELILTLQQDRILLRSSADGTVLRDILLGFEFVNRCKHIRWYTDRRRRIAGSQSESEPEYPSHLRFLVADHDTVQVYDVDDSKWNAVLKGASSTTGRIANVDFGYTPNEVLVFSDFGFKMTVWSLQSSRGVEIKDPKFPRQGHCFRPHSGHLVVLTRPDTHDIAMLLAPRTHKLVKSFTLAAGDAQGIKWSPDGRWLAVWEAPNTGYLVCIYTSDGHLFKSYNGGHNAENISLGVTTVDWDPKGSYLAIGSYEDGITLLNTNTFILAAVFEHKAVITTPNAVVYQEQIDARHERSYVNASQPTYPPEGAKQSRGISSTVFSTDGDYVATRSETMPTTVWIWSLKILAPVAILIHHAPIKSIQWHDIDIHLLMIHCATRDPVVHLWDPSWDAPRISRLRLEKSGGRIEAKWIYTKPGELIRFMLSTTKSYALSGINGEQDIPSLPGMVKSRCSGSEDMFDDGNSMDLSPIKINHNDFTTNLVNESSEIGLGEQWDPSLELDDTFDYRRRIPGIA